MEKKIQDNEFSKIKSITKSINTMVDCVNYLERIRSYEYIGSIKESELKKVLSQMKEIEERIEKLNNLSKEKEVFKAIGKNRTVWVTKPIKESYFNENNTPNCDNATNKKWKGIINKTELEKIFKKSVSSEAEKPENNIKTKLLAVKYNLANFF